PRRVSGCVAIEVTSESLGPLTIATRRPPRLTAAGDADAGQLAGAECSTYSFETSSARLVTRTLAWIRFTWWGAGEGEITSRRAIASIESPCAISASTSRSRAESP